MGVMTVPTMGIFLSKENNGNKQPPNLAIIKEKQYMTMPSPEGPEVTFNNISPSLFSFSHSFPVCHLRDLRKQFCQLHQAAVGDGKGRKRWTLQGIPGVHGHCPTPPHPHPFQRTPPSHNGAGLGSPTLAPQGCR